MQTITRRTTVGLTVASAAAVIGLLGACDNNSGGDESPSSEMTHPSSQMMPKDTMAPSSPAMSNEMSEPPMSHPKMSEPPMSEPPMSRPGMSGPDMQMEN